MLRRIGYYIQGNVKTFLFRTFLLTVFIFFFVCALLVGDLSELFEKSFSDIMDNSLTVYTKYSTSTNNLDTIKDTLEFEKELENLYDQLKEMEGISYQDYWISTGKYYPISWSSLGENNEVIANNMPNVIRKDLYDADWKSVFTDGNGFACANVYAVNNVIPKGLYIDSTVLTDGRVFTDEEIENGELVCIVPYIKKWQLYMEQYDSSLNRKILKTGDTLKVSVYCPNGDLDNPEMREVKTWDLKIIGEYTAKDPALGIFDMVKSQENDLEWPIFLPYQTLMKLQDEMLSMKLRENPDYVTQKLPHSIVRMDGFYFEMEDIQTLQKVRNVIEKTNLYQRGLLNYQSGLEGYEILLANLYTTTDSFRTIAIVIMCLSILYCGLLACLNLIYRRNEMAILHALGEKRRNIILQTVLEQMLSLMAALTVCIPLALWLVRKIVYYIFNGTHSEMMVFTKSQISSWIQYSPNHLVMIAILVLSDLVLTLCIEYLMMNKFYARALLNGDDVS